MLKHINIFFTCVFHPPLLVVFRHETSHHRLEGWNSGCGDYRHITLTEGPTVILPQLVSVDEREVLKKTTMVCIFQTVLALYWCSGGKLRR